MAAGAESQASAFLDKGAGELSLGPPDSAAAGGGTPAVPLSPYGQQTPWQTQPPPPRREGRAPPNLDTNPSPVRHNGIGSFQFPPSTSQPLAGSSLSFGTGASAFQTPYGRWQAPAVSPAGGFTFGGALLTPTPSQGGAQQPGSGAQLVSHAIMGREESSEVMIICSARDRHS